eukprot:gene22258-29328_t
MRLSTGSAVFEPVAETLQSVYKSWPENGKPGTYEYAVLAGFVVTQQDTETKAGSSPTSHVVAIGTGTKCLGGSKRSKDGNLINDSHAEAVARRALLAWLYSEASLAWQEASPTKTEAGQAAVSKQADHGVSAEASKSVFVIDPEGSGRLVMKPSVQLHLYVSQPPCGDASIIDVACTASVATIKPNTVRGAVDREDAGRGADDNSRGAADNADTTSGDVDKETTARGAVDNPSGSVDKETASRVAVDNTRGAVDNPSGAMDKETTARVAVNNSRGAVDNPSGSLYKESTARVAVGNANIAGGAVDSTRGALDGSDTAGGAVDDTRGAVDGSNTAGGAMDNTRGAVDSADTAPACSPCTSHTTASIRFRTGAKAIRLNYPQPTQTNRLDNPQPAQDNRLDYQQLVQANRLDNPQPAQAIRLDHPQPAKSNYPENTQPPGQAPTLEANRGAEDDFRLGGIVLPGATDVEGVQELGALRRKPGKGDPTLSLSCSDKIARWACLGIQGSLLGALLAHPIYISSVVVSAAPDVFAAGQGATTAAEASLQRALRDRLTEVAARLPPPFVLHAPNILVVPPPPAVLALAPTSERLVGSGASLNWSAPPALRT